MFPLDDELEIERSKTIARWIGISILTAVLYSQRAIYGAQAMAALWMVFGAAAFVNLIHSLYLFRAGSCPPYYKYFSVAVDMVVITLTIRYTGFSRSPFFFAYFMVLISNSIRYGLLMSLFIAILVNVLYVAVLSLDRPMEPSVLGGEGLKILAFWGVAMYGGVIAARMRRQAFEISACEQTIFELREQLAAAEGKSDGS